MGVLLKVLNLLRSVGGSFCLFYEEGSFFKFICFMMVEYTEIKVHESSGMKTQTRIYEIVFGRITDWKLDGNNYLQWKRVIEIYVVGRRKTSHLLTDPLL